MPDCMKKSQNQICALSKEQLKAQMQIIDALKLFWSSCSLIWMDLQTFSPVQVTFQKNLFTREYLQMSLEKLSNISAKH